MRAREYGITVGSGTPGPANAITDVGGVRVGHCTLVDGDGPLQVGRGPVRTGVSVILPADQVWERPLFAGCHRLNGNGELSGLEWVRESGTLTTPIALTNTHSVGIVRDALVAHVARERSAGAFWCLPVVGETWDGVLNDINGFHVRAEHLERAISSAAQGPVAEGAVGGGTGMICHGFKGGIGTASRVLPACDGGYTVGVLVQANHGVRERLRVNGAPVGREIGPEEIPLPGSGGLPGSGRSPGSGRFSGAGGSPGSGRFSAAGGSQANAPTSGAGSIIVVIATDAPLLAHQCTRLAQRAGLGIARMGGAGEHTSGDLLLCFATGNRTLASATLEHQDPLTVPLTMLSESRITPLFYAAIEATEEAILNAMLGAKTMTGRDGITAHALPGERVAQILRGWPLS